MRHLGPALLSCLLVLLAGCPRVGGSGSGLSATAPASTDPCSVAGENRQILSAMQDWYYWYQNLPPANPAGYNSPESFVEALRYQPLDRFSFVTTQTANDAFYSAGQYVGVGISEELTAGNELKITDVYPNSPAAAAALARGETIQAINGIPVFTLLANGTLYSAFGANQVGVSVTLQVRDTAGVVRTVTMTKAVVIQPNVSRLSIFTDGTHKVGYFFFQNFIQPSVAELDQVFSQLQQAGVDELIIDERYNGGGLLSVAQQLGSLIVGNNYIGRQFTTLNYNNRHTNQDQTLEFEQTSDGLNLSRVVFITTGATASSAELIINSLRPYIDVETVGSTTFGKPVGENGFDICKDVLYPMTFKMTNAAGYGDYFNGLAPTCPAVDDLNHPLGDQQESSLATALYYIANGSCGASAIAAARTLSMQTAVQPVPKQYGWQQLVNAN